MLEATLALNEPKLPKIPLHVRCTRKVIINYLELPKKSQLSHGPIAIVQLDFLEDNQTECEK